MLRINTTPVEEQQLDDCYQVVIDSIYKWHQGTKSGLIPGFAEAQQIAWNKSNEEYNVFKSYYETLSFEWAFALIGVKLVDKENVDQQAFEDFINNYYRTQLVHMSEVVKTKTNFAALIMRNLSLLKSCIALGREAVRALSHDEHLGLVRYHNPALKPSVFRYQKSPAALEYALRKHGPMFAAGKLFYDDDEFKLHEHTIMIVGIELDPALGSYFVRYRDGVTVGEALMSFNSFLSQLGEYSESALLCLENNNKGFLARGVQEDGILYRFKVSNQLSVNKSGYCFKNSLAPIVCESQRSIIMGEDLSDLGPDAGYVYTALPRSVFSDALSSEDLSHLSLILFSDPNDALKLLETNCVHKNDFKKTLNNNKENEGFTPKMFPNKRKLEEDDLDNDPNESPLKKQKSNE